MSEPSTAGAKVALVTGASRGIGEATARRLAHAGYRVVLVARDRAALTKLAEDLPGESLVVPADVTDPGQVEAAFAEAERAWTAVDVLVLSAGSGTAATVVDTTDEQWQRMLDLNLTAPFRCVRRALPPMLERGWGRIVVVGSVTSKRGEPMVSAYTASKHGVLGLVRSAAAEVARQGVTVNAVCPGYVDTPMTDDTVAAIAARTGRTTEEAEQVLARRQPIGRLVRADEVAQTILLCVENAAINGQAVNVDGGAVQS